MKQQGIVDIRGTQYQTVAYRIHQFREDHPISDGWGILTDLVECTKERVIIKAVVIDPNGKTVATGYAHETWTGNINMTSAVENGETSAIGRALANTGLGGEHYCSAEELQNALDHRAPKKSHSSPGDLIKACTNQKQLNTMLRNWLVQRPVKGNAESWGGIMPLVSVFLKGEHPMDDLYNTISYVEGELRGLEKTGTGEGGA